jgi:bacillopeptidase F
MILLLVSLNSEAAIMNPELQTALEIIDSEDPLPVIIKLRNTMTLRPFQQSSRQRRSPFIKRLRKHAELTQGPLLTLLKSRGAKHIIPLWVINGIAVTVQVEVITELASLSSVESIRLDDTLHVPKVIAGTSAEPEWNLDLIHAPELWSLGHTGKGIVVASMDTGVDLNHPDLTDKWRAGTNSWFDPNGEHEMPHDRNGHGTQTMGIMVGGSAGGMAIGVAPDAQWIAVKIFNDADEASLSAIHQGFQWLLDPDSNPDTDDAPDIVNSSWGSDDNVNECIYEFREDIQALRAAGIGVVFSAGNGGPSPSTSVSPANYPESFAVGAVDDNSSILVFSSRGPSVCDDSLYPSVVAPGKNVRTSDLTFGGLFPDSYSNVTGTSFAAAHLSGAMALLMSAFPCLALSELEEALKESAMDLGSSGPDNEYGYGLIDISTTYSSITPVPVTTTTSSSVTSSSTSTSSSTTTSLSLLWPMAYDKMWGVKKDKNLLLLRISRDEILLTTEVGREYIFILYNNSFEIVMLLLQDTSLLIQTRELLDEFLLNIESLLYNNEIEIRQHTIDSLKSLLNQFKSKASPKLKTIINKVERDIDKREIFGQLGITISE